MAIAERTACRYAAAYSSSVTLPAAVVANDAVVLVVGCTSGGSVTAVSGLGATWSQVIVKTTANPTLNVWVGRGCTGGGTGITITATSGSMVIAAVFSGVPTDASLVASSTSSGVNSTQTSLTTGSSVSYDPDDLVLGVCTHFGATPSASFSGSGTASRIAAATVSGPRATVLDKLVPSSSSADSTTVTYSTPTADGQWDVGLLVLHHTTVTRSASGTLGRSHGFSATRTVRTPASATLARSRGLTATRTIRTPASATLARSHGLSAHADRIGGGAAPASAALARSRGLSAAATVLVRASATLARTRGATLSAPTVLAEAAATLARSRDLTAAWTATAAAAATLSRARGLSADADTFSVIVVNASATLARSRDLTADNAMFVAARLAADLVRTRTLHATANVLPPIAAPPPGADRYIWRVSPTYPDPVLDADGRPVDWAPSSVVVEDWARFRVLVRYRDVSYFRDVPLVPSWENGEPFADAVAVVPMPALTPFDVPGEGALDWLVAWSKVDIQAVTPTDEVETLFQGLYASLEVDQDETASNLAMHCIGALYQAGLAMQQPPFVWEPVDIGQRIARMLNEVISRKYGLTAEVDTGILTRRRGSRDQDRLDFVQTLLADAVLNNGSSQYTVDLLDGRVPAIVLKDRTTVHWDISAGTPGLSLALSDDASQVHNVTYAQWVTPHGCVGENLKTPHLHPDTAPAYPFTDPDRVFTVGTTDADTDSGDGVSTWQRRANDWLSHGYEIAVDGVYDAVDEAACREIQEHAGILEDGIVGPQTWNATFLVGQDQGDLTACHYEPVARDPRVMMELWNAAGARISDNPSYDPTIVRVERFENFGTGITKRQVLRSAKAEMVRDGVPVVATT